MHEIELSSLDLNLLVPLAVLLEEASVTRAARRLHRTQSAVSHTLGRLRATFDDPLLVRSGRGFVLSPRALALRAPLDALLADVGRLLGHGTHFDPATSQRRFRLAAPDLLGPLVPGLLSTLHRAAPGIRLGLEPRPAGPLEGALDGPIDVLLGPRPSRPVAGLVQKPLGRVHWATFCRAGHPLLARPDLAGWLAWPHVLIRTGSTGRGFIAEQLAARGLERRVALTVPSFLLAPQVVAGSDLLFTGIAELMGPVAEQLGLARLEPPLDLPPVPVVALWHERHQRDPGHRWFREVVVAEVRRGALATPGTPPAGGG